MNTKAYFWRGPNSLLYRLDRAPEFVEQVVVFVPPLFEDANNIRHAYTKLASTIINGNIASVVFDYSGTGDSELDLEQVTVNNWQEELIAICQHVKAQFKVSKVILVACYSAVLMFTEHLFESVEKLVLWHPEASGKKYLKQLRRLMMLQGGNIPENFDDGQELIAGYVLSSQMLDDLSDCSMPAMKALEVHWFELCPTEALSPAREKLVDFYRTKCRLSLHILKCDKFWQATELLSPIDLLEQTKQKLTEL